VDDYDDDEGARRRKRRGGMGARKWIVDRRYVKNGLDLGVPVKHNIVCA